jgi:hypothetical protein
MVQILTMNNSYKYNSMQPLVHRNCHQLPKPRMGLHGLSSSRDGREKVAGEMEFLCVDDMHVVPLAAPLLALWAHATSTV